MNILQVQDALKGMSEQQLVQEIQRPSGQAPTFLVATELDRRKKMTERYQERQPPQQTVVQDLVGGIASMMNPQAQQMPQQMPQGISQEGSLEPSPVARFAIGGAVARGLASLFGRGQPALRGAARPMSRGILEGTPKPVASATPKTGSSGLLGLGPFGVGTSFLLPTSMGDGTMAARYGLSEEDYALLVAEAEKRDITPYDTEEFGRLAEAVKSQDNGTSRQSLIDGAQGGQETGPSAQQNEMSMLQKMLENEKRQGERARKFGIARAGLDFAYGGPEKGLRTLIDSQESSAKPGAISTLMLKEKIKKMIGGDKDKLTNMLKFRTELGKQVTDPMIPEEQKQAIMMQLQQIDNYLATALGVSGQPTGGQDFSGLIKSAIANRNQ